MRFNIIVCVDSEGGISKEGKIPWKIQEDYNFFRDIITYSETKRPNVIIMGRNTFEDMNLVKGHINIIISTTLETIKTDEKVYIFKNEEEAINKIDTLEYNKIFVCGGKRLYDTFLNKGNHNLYLTVIDKNYNCDNKLNYEIDSIDLQYYNFNTFNCNDIKNNETVSITIYTPKYNQLKSDENLDEKAYLNLMNSIITTGKYAPCRNGHTYSKFGNMLRFELNRFPLLTTKKMFFKGVFEELMYFLKGDTNSKHLSDIGVKIWEKNTTKEFIEKCNLPYEEYDMGPMYGFQWRHFNAHYEGFKGSYQNKGFDQLHYVLSELKQNPNSRRILMTTYNPAQAKEGVLFPCHGISIQFNTEPIDGNHYKLNISQNQRSCDYFLGVPFNIASYALLNYMVCHVLNNDPECKYKYEPGELIMFLGDYHIYKEHKVQAIRQIMRTPNKFPTLKFNRNVTNITDFSIEDIEICEYDSHPGILAEMIA